MTPYPFLLNGRVNVIAHRGDTANHPPGNTWSAFSGALELGVDHLESDVQLSSDGELVLFHDDRLEASTTGVGTVADHPWAALETMTYTVDGTVTGDHLVRLVDALAAWPDAFWNLDAKVREAVEPLLAAIDSAGAHERVLVTSFSYRTARALERRRTSTTPRGASQLEVVGARLASLAGAPAPGSAAAVQLPECWKGMTIVDEKFVEAAHRGGKTVHVWTVNDPSDMNRLFDLGVDGIITDDPAAARRVLQARGEW